MPFTIYETYSLRRTGKQRTSLDSEGSSDDNTPKRPSKDDGRVLIPEQTGFNPFDVQLNSIKEVDTDLGHLRGHNLVSGTLGWTKDPTKIIILLDTGSDLSFISKSTLAKLSSDIKISVAPPIKVRLTNGETSVADRCLVTGLTIGDFRARTNLRILDWDAYDVILGMD